MRTASFNGLLIISVIAVMAPVLAARVKALKLPSAVVEIAAGIIVGPSVLAWVKIDQPVNVVALLGLAFLLRHCHQSDSCWSRGRSRAASARAVAGDAGH